MKRALGLAFYVLVAVFLVLYAQSLDFTALAGISPNWWLVLGATLLALFARFWFARIWIFFLTSSGATLDGPLRRELYLVYAKAWLGRYVPGSVVWVAGKVYFASKLGISKTKLAISSYLEALIQLATTLLLAVLLITLDPATRLLAQDALWLMVLLLIIGLIAIFPPVLRRYASLGYRLIRKQVLDPVHFPSSWAMANAALRFTLSAVVSGLAFFLVLWSLIPDLGISNLLYVLALTAIANALSMVAVFAPAGIGVREGVLIAGLALVIDPAIALVAALLMRVMSVIWDGLFFGLAKALQAGK